MFWLKDAIEHIFYPQERLARRERVQHFVDEKYRLLYRSIHKMTDVASWSVKASETLVDTLIDRPDH